MANSIPNKEDVEAWTRRQLAKGYPIDEIKNVLIKRGYKEEKVAQIVSGLLPTEEKEEEKIEDYGKIEKKRKEKTEIPARYRFTKNKKIAALLFLGVVCIILVFLIISGGEKNLLDQISDDLDSQDIKAQQEKVKKDSKILFDECKFYFDVNECLMYAKGNVSYLENTRETGNPKFFEFDLYKKEYSSRDISKYHMFKAIMEKDVALCDRIDEQQLNILCRVAVLNDPSICEESTEINVKELLIKFEQDIFKGLCAAYANKELSSCGLIIHGDDDEIIDDCKLEINLLNALQDRDVEKCNNINEIDIKANCKSLISNSQEHCSDYATESCTNLMNFFIANQYITLIQSESIEICNLISDKFLKRKCLAEVNENKNQIIMEKSITTDKTA